MKYNGIDQQHRLTIDSIFLFSTTNKIILTSYEFIGSTGVLVLTEDSLDFKFHIKRFADTIKVISYSQGHAFEDVLIFGNLSGTMINYPKYGQSICKIWIYYTKDNSPSIGFLNDTIGIFGTLKGTIYDKYSIPVKNRTFILEDYYFNTNVNVEYSTRVYLKPSNFCRIGYLINKSSTKLASIKEVSYIMEPDSIIERGIYLLDSLISNMNNVMKENSPIKIYPNPISANGELKVIIDLPVITSEVFIDMIDINGKVIMRRKINENYNIIKIPNKSGCYILRIILDSNIILSEKIIVND